MTAPIPHMESGNLRIDVVDETASVVISIVEEHAHGGVEVHAIQLDFATARMMAHYLLEHV